MGAARGRRSPRVACCATIRPVMVARGEQSRTGLLGLPLAAPRWTAFCALALLVYYALSMSRSLSLYDSPELALVAAQLGLGHPFGQPLHTMLGALFARIPGLDPLLGLNALSALAGALTLVPATSLSEALVRAKDKRALRFVPPSLALLGVYPTLWEPATRIEVYSLASFFALWGMARLIQAWQDREPRLGPYMVAGLSLGLSASANPVCAAVAAAALGPALLFGVARERVGVRGLGMVALGGVLGLSCYLYVFAVAGRQDALVWGAPRDAEALFHYFTAADFAPKQVGSLADWGSHVASLLAWSADTGLIVVLLLGLLGFALFTAPPALGLSVSLTALVLVFAFIARNGVFAPDVLDYLGYLAIPTWLAACGASALIVRLASQGMAQGVVGLTVLAAFTMLAPTSVFARTRHRDRLTEELAQQTLRRAPKDALLLLEHDHWVGPLMYVQEQEGLRPDVVVLAYGLSSSSWYWDQLYRRHPDLVAFELRGPGGRSARVRRFIDANAGRPVQAEHLQLASRLGLGACPSAWLLDLSRPCDPGANALELPIWLADQVDALDGGSPGAEGMAAHIAFQRGHDLLLLGRPREAIATLLAASPEALAGGAALDLSRVPAQAVPGPPVAAPQYEPRVALGHPAHNLHYAARIARENGATELASALQALSEELGPVHEAAP